MVSLLEQFLVGQIFAFLMIFCRVGAALMVLPGFGEAYIAPNIRLCFALMFSLVLTPLFAPIMPEAPGAPLTLLLLIAGEVLVGIFFGFFCRLLVNTLHVTGTIIANQSSLALASFFDTTQNAQSTVIGNFLTITAVVMFFAMDMHHVMLTGIAETYGLFTPGQMPIAEDMADHLMRTMSDVFAISVQLSAAHIVFALIFYLGSGVMSRVMPTMQVFFVLMPPQIMIGIFLLLAMLNAILLTYSDFVEESIAAFIEPQ